SSRLSDATALPSFPTRRSSDLAQVSPYCPTQTATITSGGSETFDVSACDGPTDFGMDRFPPAIQPSNGSVSLTPATGGVQFATRSEEHTSELQSRENLVCRLLL